MKFFAYTCGILLLFLLSLPLLALFVVLEDEARYPINSKLDQEQIASIQEILINYDPRRLANTKAQQISLSEAESNALLVYFSQQINGFGIDWLSDNTLFIELSPGRAVLKGGVVLMPNIFGRHLNFEAQLIQTAENFQLQEFRIADYKIPDFIFRPLLDYSKVQLSRDSDYQLINSVLASVSQFVFDDNYLGLTVNWESGNLADIREQARLLLIDPQTTARLITYQEQLLQAIQSIPATNRSVSLNNLFRPLFSFALNDQDNPREENRAILLILSCYLLDELDLQDLLGPSAAEFTSPRQLRITLENRDDLPRHLIASAAIAAYADDNLANIVSIFKEVQDSRSSSGFSFSDITANLIGTRLGRLSMSDNQTAEQLQLYLSQVPDESAYIPLLGQPDGISEAEFIAIYGNRNSEAYLMRMQSIEQSIAELDIFKELL
tara:strand:+ start:317 stop:1630 length:1314 start_codon:yes stop_codon:yes gene_type:complete